MGTWDPKPVGVHRTDDGFVKPRLNTIDRNIILMRHFAKKDHAHCQFCKQEWPCDAAQVLHDLFATEAAFRRNITMPF